MSFNHFVASIFVYIGFISCTSNFPLSNDINIAGKWVSTDKSDTLKFDGTTGSMYHSNATLRNAAYQYLLKEDSIVITYVGKNTVPTIHLYYTNQDYLSIDFRKTNCYGFSRSIMNYFRWVED